MKTKLLALILASLMCFNTVALTSCFGEDDPETSEPPIETTEKSEDTTTEGEETTTEEEDTTTEDDEEDTTTEDDGEDTTTEEEDTTTEDDGEDTTTEEEDTTEATVENKISFKTLTVDGTNVSGVVSNATTSFSFLNEITLSGNATYAVSTNVTGTALVPFETVELEIGDNIFYIFETVGNENTLYTVTIRRRPMYTVDFNTNGGTAVASQTVEEDSFATVPTAPTKTGYTFAGWSRDLTLAITEDMAVSAQWTNNPYVVTYDANGGTVTNATTNVGFDLTYTLEIPTRVGYTFAGWYNGNDAFAMSGTWTLTQNITLKAKWTANTDTAYKVEHYLEKLDGTYELRDTDNLTGTSDSQVKPNTKTYTGFTAPTKQTVTVLPDGSQVVKYYYTRNSYTITFVTNGGTSINTQALKYESSLPDAERSGFTFGGWFTDSALLSSIEQVPAQNRTFYAYWSEENKPSDFTYSGTSSIAITDYTASDTMVCIPSYISGKKVTSIGSYAFAWCDSLTSVTIGDSVTNIGDDAFFLCYSLTSITIPNSVTNIGSYAFSYCDSLTSIEIPNSVTSIGDYAFAYCDRLTSVTIGNSVTNIGNSAFRECSSLTSIVIPDSVTSIGENTFSGCNNLANVSIGNGVTSIGSDAFNGCGSLTSVTIGNGVTSIGLGAFERCSSLTSMTIPFVGASLDGTENTHFSYIFGNPFYYYSTDVPTTLKTVIITGGTSIGAYAFAECSGLTSVTIPNSVTSIGDSAFYNCSSLTSITVPNSVTSIGREAFNGCTSLTSIMVANDNNYYASIDGTLYSKDKTILIQYASGNNNTTFSIPNSVTSIGDWAFYWCSSLTSVTIPNSVTSIGDFAFYNCSSLTSITIPNGVTSIGDSAFAECSGLTSITIPNSVTSIGLGAFFVCSSLTSVTIGDSVTDIGNSAFNECTSLRSITVANDNSYYMSIDGNLYSKDGTLLIKYAIGKNNTTFSIPNGVTSIGESAFQDCRSLTSVTIPNSVTIIGDSAFSECSSLTNVTIPNSVTSIGLGAFYECSSLMSVTIGNSVTSIGFYAFAWCDNLTSVMFENKQGWTAGTTAIFSTDLENTSTAATYLKETYYNRTWTRS